jgi:hypothetical protein
MHMLNCPHKSMHHPPYRVSNSSTSRGGEVVRAEGVAIEAVPNMAAVEEEEASQHPILLSWEAT